MSDGPANAGAERRIDVHHHVLPPQYEATTPMPFKVSDTATQLRTMDEFRIEAAITSLTPRVFEEHGHERRAVARACNEYMASLVRDHPGRFGAFATLPLPDVDGALEEVTYALDTLGLDGIGLFSSSESKFLGDPLYDPLFEELNRRKALVFMHPAHCKAPDELNLATPPSCIEYIFDSTRAILNMLVRGTFRRSPDVRIIFCHGGSTIPYLAGRISGLEQSAKVPDVIGTLRALYYDVASAMTPYALPSLQALADPAHILWGSDLPFVSGAKLAHEIAEWEEYQGFDAATRRAIERDNALRLFPRLATVGHKA
ncbi:MAG TPA: amidohydrolase family protein [Chloroflexota bacterium]|jgi:predicted TIM-barrel fold metal-dependent hydrolase